MSAQIHVTLGKCAIYDRRLLRASMEKMAPWLGLKPSYAGRTVLLKPNLISSRGPALGCTHGEFIAAAAACFVDRGAKVRIGDSPAFGTTCSVMDRHGLVAALADLPVELVNFRQPQSYRVAGVRLSIAAEALECDLLVNLPKLKAHNQMYLTGGVKNIFGIVLGVHKAMLHMRCNNSHRRFADILLQLVSLLPPNISLLDGIEAMHVSGPLDGEPHMLNCIGGSSCPVALDTALLQVLELDHQRSPLWRAAEAIDHVGSRIENLSFPLDAPDDFKGTGFVAPAGLNDIRFNLFRLLRGGIKRLALHLKC